jgi:hypothetical protein
MILTVKRKWREGEALIGELYIDGVYECLTLEPSDKRAEHPAIPVGLYPVILTTSERARKGSLWTPRKDFALPLVQNVPGREGIRFHAGNTPEETDGCVLVGKVKGEIPGKIFGSRVALASLVEKIEQARGSVSLLVEDVGA